MSNCHRSRSLGSIPFSSVEDKSVMSIDSNRDLPRLQETLKVQPPPCRSRSPKTTLHGFYVPLPPMHGPVSCRELSPCTSQLTASLLPTWNASRAQVGNKERHQRRARYKRGEALTLLQGCVRGEREQRGGGRAEASCSSCFGKIPGVLLSRVLQLP